MNPPPRSHLPIPLLIRSDIEKTDLPSLREISKGVDRNSESEQVYLADTQHREMLLVWIYYVHTSSNSAIGCSEIQSKAEMPSNLPYICMTMYPIL